MLISVLLKKQCTEHVVKSFCFKTSNEDGMMEIDTMIESARELIKPFRVTDRQSFRLKDFDPADTLDLNSEDKPRAKEGLAAGIEILAKLQEKLYAQNRWAVLVIFQAMDTAGKDSVIKHVMSGVNPQGCQVHSFKAPSSEELDHDYLWRCARRLRGARHHRPFQSELL